MWSFICSANLLRLQIKHILLQNIHISARKVVYNAYLLTWWIFQFNYICSAHTITLSTNMAIVTVNKFHLQILAIMLNVAIKILCTVHICQHGELLLTSCTCYSIVNIAINILCTSHTVSAKFWKFVLHLLSHYKQQTFQIC